MKWWSVPICAECWNIAHPERAPVVLLPADEDEPCICCLLRPHTGIYVRMNADGLWALREKTRAPSRDDEHHD